MSIYYKEEGMEFPSKVFEESKELTINLDSSERKIKNIKNTPIRMSKNKIQNDVNSVNKDVINQTSYQQQQKIDLKDKMQPKIKIHDSLSNLFRRNVSQINTSEDKQDLIQNTFKKIFISETNSNLDLLIPPQIQAFSSKSIKHPKQSIFEYEAQFIKIKDYISFNNVNVLIQKQLPSNLNLLTNLAIKFINNTNKSIIYIGKFSKSQSEIFNLIKQNQVNITLLKQDNQRFVNQLLTIGNVQNTQQFKNILRQFKNQSVGSIIEFVQSQKIQKHFLPPIDQQTEQKQTSEQILQLSENKSKIFQQKNQIQIAHIEQKQLQQKSPIKECVEDNHQDQIIQQKHVVEDIIIQQQIKPQIVETIPEQSHQIPVSVQPNIVEKVEQNQVLKPNQTSHISNPQIDDDEDDFISQVINESINNGQEQELSDCMSMKRYTQKRDFGNKQQQKIVSNSKNIFNVPTMNKEDNQDQQEQSLLDQLRKSQRIKPRDSGYLTPHGLRYSFQLPSDQSTIYQTSRQYKDSSMSYQKSKPNN